MDDFLVVQVPIEGGMMNLLENEIHTAVKMVLTHHWFEPVKNRCSENKHKFNGFAKIDKSQS